MAKKTFDPFNPKQAGIRDGGTTSKKGGLSSVDSRDPEAIDQYVKTSHQSKALEGELKRLRSVVGAEGLEVYGGRATSGDVKNFKLQGNEHFISHISQDKVAAIDSAKYSMLVETYGEKLVERVVEPDLSSVRFNVDLLMTHRDKIVELLSPLGAEVLGQLFTKPVYKSRKSVQQLLVDEAKGLAKGKTAKQYTEQAAREAADAKALGRSVAPRRPDEVAFTNLMQDFGVTVQLRSQTQSNEDE